MASAPDPEGYRLKRFLLAKEFAEVFQSQKFQAIPIRRLTQAYQSKHRRNFFPRKLGFSNLENLINELPIFSRVSGGGVALNRSNFLDFFFRPVLKQCGGTTGVQRIPAITRTFKSYTGIEIDSICKVLEVVSVEELLSEVTTDQHRQKQVQGAALHSATRENNEHVHGRTDRSSVERESLQDGSSIQSSETRGRAKLVEGDSGLHRDPSRMDVDEYPLLSKPPRALLPHPTQHHTHSVIGSTGPTPAPQQVPIVRQQPFPSQSPFLQQMHPRQDFSSNIPTPINFGAISPPLQSTRPHHQHQDMVSLPRQQPPHGAETGGWSVLVDPRHSSPGQPSGDVLPEYLPLSPGPKSAPRQISPSSSPSLSPGPQPHVVVPQVITSRPLHIPPSVGHPSPLSLYQPRAPTTNEMDPKFPHPNLALWQETILPSHSKFRPNMPVPQIPPGATELSSPKKKRGAVVSDTKQKVIQKINAKVEELIGDLSSQGKFLQPDIVRKLVLEMINKENRSRHDRIVLWDITAMADYSKVHGRIEELIKVFCWFSPVTSLHELEQAIIESEKVDTYEALHLGPITKHPKVIDLFKLQEAASLDTVPDISAYKIQNYLMKFLSKRKRSEKYSLEDFLEYVREREFAESVYHLCIRITSFPLAIQVRVL